VKDPSAIYNEAFYADAQSWHHQYVALGNCISALLGGPRTVFDIGCGAGLVIARLQELGHDVRGVDGSSHAIAAAPKEIENRVAQRDVCASTRFSIEADVVICTEVAEHLEAEHADTLVEVVARSARKMIVWSAAPPGQGGVDHCNEQPPEYWLERFAEKGWAPDRVPTDALRILMWEWKAQHGYARSNFHVLKRSNP
jgi:SAM-dependent methyltransferase